MDASELVDVWIEPEEAVVVNEEEDEEVEGRDEL